MLEATHREAHLRPCQTSMLKFYLKWFSSKCTEKIRKERIRKKEKLLIKYFNAVLIHLWKLYLLFH